MESATVTRSKPRLNKAARAAIEALVALGTDPEAASTIVSRRHLRRLERKQIAATSFERAAKGRNVEALT